MCTHTPLSPALPQACGCTHTPPVGSVGALSAGVSLQSSCLLPHTEKALVVPVHSVVGPWCCNKHCQHYLLPGVSSPLQIFAFLSSFFSGSLFFFFFQKKGLLVNPLIHLMPIFISNVTSLEQMSFQAVRCQIHS